jgi:hypothetical protein
VTTVAWGRAVDEALADGAWHPIEEVLAAGAAAVPPGVAYRQGERRRQEHPGANPQRRQGGTEQSVDAGARRLLRNLLIERVRRGTIERHGDEVRKVARSNP